MTLKLKTVCYLSLGEWQLKSTVPSIATKSTHILAANFSHPKRDVTCHQFHQYKVVAGTLDITKMDQLAFQPKRPDSIEFIFLFYKAHFSPERKTFCKRSQIRHSTGRDNHWLLDLCPPTYSFSYYPNLQDLRSRNLVCLSSNKKS